MYPGRLVTGRVSPTSRAWQAVVRSGLDQELQGPQTGGTAWCRSTSVPARATSPPACRATSSGICGTKTAGGEDQSTAQFAARLGGKT